MQWAALGVAPDVAETLITALQFRFLDGYIWVLDICEGEHVVTVMGDTQLAVQVI